MVSKILKVFGGILALILLVYFMGPVPEDFVYKKELPKVPSLEKLEPFLMQNESSREIKPGNHARIVWANDSIQKKTKYAIVYLHGFSASEKEGMPGHENLAKRFGCNLFLSRLQAHGIAEEEELLTMTSSGLYASAQEALAIGMQLGEKVILIGTSTGGTLALKLAAEYPQIAGLILYSPNIAIYDPTSVLLNDPWGLEIARIVLGDDYNYVNNDLPEYGMYWNTKYRIEALVELEQLVEETMKPEVFEKVTCPVYLAYYYKNEEEQDKTVSVPAMLEMFKALGTTAKRKTAFPEAGSHVIGSSITSGQYKELEDSTRLFMTQYFDLQ